LWVLRQEEAERAGHKEIAKIIREWKEEQARKKRERGEEIDLDVVSDEEL